MITSNPGGKPPAKDFNKLPKINKAPKKGYSKRVPPGGTDMRDLPSRGSASTAKKVKSFIKKYSQGMQ
jgi:hypothetical protein